MRKVYALLFVVLTFYTSGIANACSCVSWSSLEEHMNAVDAVFIGKTLSTRINKPQVFLPVYDDTATTTFNVLEVWKGPTKSQIQINHGTVVSSCGEMFIPDMVVIVFALSDPEGNYYTSQCSMPRYAIPSFGNRKRHPVDVHLNEKYIRALLTVPSWTID